MMWIPIVIKLLEISIAIIALIVVLSDEFGDKINCSHFPEQFLAFMKYTLIFN